MGPLVKAHAGKPTDEVRLKSSLIALVARRRDAILEAIASSARELLRSSDLNASLQKVVECVGPAAGADRVHILLKDEARLGDGEFAVKHYSWSAPGFSAPAGFYSAIGKSMAEMQPDSWASLLAGGEAIVGNARDFGPAARKRLEKGGVKSVLTVPLFIDDVWCGSIGFDDCRAERDWLHSEIETIKILAELISAAIFSSRRLQVLADANRAVEFEPDGGLPARAKLAFPADVRVEQHSPLRLSGRRFARRAGALATARPRRRSRDCVGRYRGVGAGRMRFHAARSPDQTLGRFVPVVRRQNRSFVR